MTELFAMADSGGAGGGGSFFAQMLPLFLILFIVYFLMIRPQVKRQKATREMLGALKKGDKVVTSGGIIGTIVGLEGGEDDILSVKVDQNVKLDIQRSAVTKVVKKDRN